MLLTAIPLASLPKPGLDPSAIDALGSPGSPARLSKQARWNAVEYVPVGDGGKGDYSVFKYWQDSQTWRPEGSKGEVPTTFDTKDPVVTMLPSRVFTELDPAELCVVNVSKTGVTNGGKPALIEAALQQRMERVR